MTYDESLVDRYKAVVAHAERGEGNEKANAQRLREKMEAQYPGIRNQAFPPKAEGFDPFRAWKSRKDTPSEEEEKPRGRKDRRGGGGFGNFRFDKDRWASVANEAFGFAARMAEEMGSLGTARAYAESITEVQSKVLQSEKYQIAVKFVLRDLYEVSANMNELQRIEFARYVGAMVEAQVLALLNETA